MVRRFAAGDCRATVPGSWSMETSFIDFIQARANSMLGIPGRWRSAYAISSYMNGKNRPGHGSRGLVLRPALGIPLREAHRLTRYGNIFRAVASAAAPGTNR